MRTRSRELAILLPDEADQFDGQVIAHWEMGRGSCIEQADPRIKVSAKWIRHVLSGGAGDVITADMSRLTLRAQADGQTFIYRIVGYCPEQEVYLAAWPD